MNPITYGQNIPQQKMINKICKIYTCQEIHKIITQLFKRTKIKNSSHNQTTECSTNWKDLFKQLQWAFMST